MNSIQTYPDTLALSLYPDNYTVELRENGALIATQSVTIPGSFVNPAGVLDSISKEICPYTGIIHSRITGGRAPFTFVLKNSGGATLATQTNNGIFTGITAGTYSIQITDSCGNVRIIPAILVTSVSGIKLSFGNSNMSIGDCSVNNCNGTASPIAEVINQTCTGVGIIAAVQMNDYNYGGAGYDPKIINSIYYNTQADMAKNDPVAFDTSATYWPADLSQPLNPSPYITGANTNKLIGMVGGIPPYKYYLRRPNGTIAGPQIRPVFYNQTLGGVYMIIGEDACGTRDTLRVTTSTLPSLDSFEFSLDNSSQNICAPLNLQTFTGTVRLKTRIDSARINKGPWYPSNPGQYFMGREPGVGPYTWEIESTNDPSFTIPPAVTSWTRYGGGNFAHANAANTSGIGLSNAQFATWDFKSGNFPMYFKGTYSYIVKATDRCGQVMRYNLQPSSSNVDTIDKPISINFERYGCGNQLGRFYNVEWPDKPKRERFDLEIYDTTGFLHYREVDAYYQSANYNIATIENFTLKYLPKVSKLVFKLTGKCTGAIVYDTVSFADYNIVFTATPIQPCIKGGLGSVKLKRTVTFISGTNSPKISNLFGRSTFSPIHIYREYWTPDSVGVPAASNPYRYNTGVPSNTPAFDWTRLNDSITIGSMPIGKYTAFAHIAAYGGNSGSTYNQTMNCMYDQFNIIDYDDLKIEARSEPVCTPDTVGTITTIATDGRSPFRYQIKKLTDPVSNYSVLQASPIFANKLPDNYTIRVFDTCGNANTLNTTLGGIQAFNIAGNSPICSGSTLRLKATNSQSGLKVTWFKDGVIIPSANSKTYYRYNMTAADAGVYKCELEDTLGTCGKDSALLTVSVVVGGGTATASPSKYEYCEGDTIVLSGTNSGTLITTGNWTVVSAPNFDPIKPVFTAGTTTNTNVINTFYTDQLIPYEFMWEVNNGTCTMNDTASVQVHKIPEPFAGPNTVVCQQTAINFGANSLRVGEQGFWTQVSGPSSTIVSPTLTNSLVTGLSWVNKYKYKWTVWNIQDPTKLCARSHTTEITNSMVIPRLPNAGSDTVLCTSKSNISYNLKANSIGIDTATQTWTILSRPSGAVASFGNTASSTSSFTSNMGGDYVLEWSFTNPCGIWRDSMKLTVVMGNAGPDRATCDTFGMSMQIQGSLIPSGMNAVWRRLSNSAGTAIMNDTTIYNPTLSTFTAKGKYYYEYRMVHPSCTVRDTTIITMNGITAKPNAGTDSTMCANLIPLKGSLGSAADSTAVVSWLKIGSTPVGGALLKFDTLKTTAINTSIGTYMYQLTVQNPGCPATFDTTLKTISGIPPTVVVDSFKNVTCSNLNNGIIYVSSTPSGNHQYNLNGSPWQASNIFNNLAVGTYTVNVRDANAPSCTNTALLPVTITSLNPAPVANAGRDTAVCVGKPAPLGVAPVVGNTYLWAAALGMSSTTISNPTFTASSSNVYTRTLEVTTTATGCKAFDTVIVTVNALPTPAITSSNAAMCGGQTRTLTGTPAGGTFIGAQVSGAIFTAPATAGNYTVKYVVTNAQGCSDTATQTITVNPKIALTAVSFSPTTVCVGSITTANSTPSGGTWSVLSGPGTINAVSGDLTTSAASMITVRFIHPGISGSSCPDTIQGTITPVVRPTVAPSASPSTICNGASTTIAANAASGTAPYTYAWNIGTGASHSQSPTSNTAYNVTVTDNNSCTATGTVNVTVTGSTPLAANAGSAIAICNGASTTLGGSPTGTGGAGGYTYSWSSNPAGFSSTAANPSASPTATTTYTVTVTSSSCTVSSSVVVTVNPRPSVAPSATPPSICNGQSSTIAANATGGTAPLTYTWNIGSGASHSQSPTATTAYNVTVQDNNNCTASGTVTVNVTGSTPLAADAGTARAICNGASTTLGGAPTGTGGAGGYTYSWSSNPAGFSSTAANPSASPTATTTYTVTVTSSGCTVSSNVVVTVNPRPTIAPSATPATICNGQSSTIAANGSGGTGTLTYTWNIGSGASHTQSPATTTAYNPTVTDANGCTATGSVTLNVVGISPLTANAGSARTICSGVTTNLGGSPTAIGGSGGYTYSWSSTPAGFSSTAANPSASPTTTTTYTVTVTSSTCTVSSSVVVTVNPSPAVAPSASASTICNGQSVTINANATGGTPTLTYAWNNGSGASHTQSPTANTTYIVTVTDANGCTVSGSVSVTVTGSTPLAADAGSARAICNGSTTNLGGSPTGTGGAGGYTYSWSSNPAGFSSTTANPSASPTATTTYTVTVTSSGCTATSSVVVTVNPRPTVNVTASPATLCNGQSTTISSGATGGTGTLAHTWSSGSGASFTATPSSTTSYSVTVTDANGCTASGSVTVVVTGTSPLVAVAGTARAICNGSTTTVGGSPTASGGAGSYTYAWSGGLGVTANPVASPSSTTWYRLTVTSSGCTAVDSVLVTVNPRPNVAPSASVTNVCYGGSSTVNANGSGGTGTITYNWSPSGAGASFVATPNATTIYNVTATDANGCTATGNVSVNVIGSSPLTANAGTNRTICDGSSTNLGATPTGTGGNTAGSYTYAWSSNPAGFSSTAANPTVSPSATTTYTVTVTNSTCTATNSVVVSVNPRPAAAPSASVNPVCSGSNTTIAANASLGTSPYTYQWNTSQTSASFVASPTTTVAVTNAYTVTVTDVNNCSIAATINVNVTPLPVMTPIANQSVCIPASGGSVALSAAAMTVGQTGAWSTITSPTGAVTFSAATAANTNVTTLSPINTYTFRWTLTENGCSNWTNTNVTVNESPVIEAGVNDTICRDNSSTLSASLTSVSPATINWKANTLTATPFAFTASTVVSPTTTTRYIFTAAITPCIVSDTLTVAVTTPPVIADDLTTCLTATEDIPTTFNIPATIGANDNLSPVLKGGVTYKIVSSKNSTVSVSGTTVNYASNLNFNGSDTVVIEAYSNSCTWLRDTSMFCVNVSAMNDKPELKNDTVRAIGSNPKTFNPLSNDSDVETTLKGGNIKVLSGPNHGTLTGPAANGEMTYTANNSNLAILDTIVYEVCDSGLPMPAQCDIARIIVQLVPEVKDSTAKTSPGSPVTIGPAITLGPGVSMTPKLEGKNGASGTTITTPSGTATINPTTGVMTFTPNDTPFVGKDTIRKILCFTYPGGSEVCDTSIVVISNPSVTNTTVDSTPMNTPKVVGTLKPYKFEGGVATTTTTPNAKVDPVTGAVTYTPKPGFVGIDTVKVTRCDSKGNCVTDIMVVKVNPDLKDTTTRVPQGLPVTLKMPITRYPGQQLTSTILTNTKNGTATVGPDGSVTYQSNPNFTGRDTLVRRICIYDSSTMQTMCDTIMEIFDVFPHKTNPDIAVGNMGETISGNVSTNDQVLPGTTYGSPIASSGNPSSAVPTMNPNGTYTFNTTVPGTYVFTVPVCPPGYTTGCPTETLTITVVDPSRKDNKPIVNADRAITKPSTAVKVDVLANDATGNIGIPLNRSSLTVATAPKNGTAVVNADGTITYTPNAGFLGRDTFYYNICDQATPPNCAIGMAVVNVTNEDLADVRDDVAKGNGVLTGNVLSNDKFPAGSTPSVKPIDTLIAGKGRLVIDANGNYTWTPVNGFNGSIQMPVTVCDGKTPQTCYTSTLHVVSTISADVMIPNYFSPNGDGVNDVWSLDDLLDRYPNARAVIYNRWGNIVWRSTGPYGRSTSGRNLWHGQLEGSQDNVPDGVYYYLLELEDEFKTTKTGFIEIMRQ